MADLEIDEHILKMLGIYREAWAYVKKDGHSSGIVGHKLLKVGHILRKVGHLFFIVEHIFNRLGKCMESWA
jgi:hypothetical protein